MLGLLISNQFHLQHQFCQMHKQLYQQHGETKAKYNSTFKRCLPCDIINHSTVSTFLKGACNLKSLTPKYFTIWDVNTLLSHIQHKHISAFHEILKKLATLFMIFVGTRVNTLVHLKATDMYTTDTEVNFTFDEVLKHSQPS